VRTRAERERRGEIGVRAVVLVLYHDKDNAHHAISPIPAVRLAPTEDVKSCLPGISFWIRLMFVLVGVVARLMLLIYGYHI
jgi:hypothetical protein